MSCGDCSRKMRNRSAGQEGRRSVRTVRHFTGRAPGCRSSRANTDARRRLHEPTFRIEHLQGSSFLVAFLSNGAALRWLQWRDLLESLATKDEGRFVNELEACQQYPRRSSGSIANGWDAWGSGSLRVLVQIPSPNRHQCRARNRRRLPFQYRENL